MFYSILLLDMLHCSPPFEYINPLVKKETPCWLRLCQIDLPCRTCFLGNGAPRSDRRLRSFDLAVPRWRILSPF